MGFYEAQVLPRIIDKACGIGQIDAVRSEVTAGLAGRVVEVGFGSGLNLPHLPAEVRELLAVDPATTGRRLARRRLDATPARVDFVGLDGAHLPLDDASVDGALSTFTLCTIGDVELALRELRRVLRPGGELHFLEHGLSPDRRVARWQHRLTPIQRRLFGGCHLDRPIDRLITTAGFELERLENRYLAGPKVPGYLYLGIARRPG
jgi:ubiquinone/menaquinone biosynthesis C-methylase UbiE